MIKLLVDSVISTGKILKQLKYFSFNKIFIHRFINRLLHTNRYKDQPLGVAVHGQFAQNSASKQKVKGCCKICNVVLKECL